MTEPLTFARLADVIAEVKGRRVIASQFIPDKTAYVMDDPDRYGCKIAVVDPDTHRTLSDMGWLTDDGYLRDSRRVAELERGDAT